MLTMEMEIIIILWSHLKLEVFITHLYIVKMEKINEQEN